LREVDDPLNRLQALGLYLKEGVFHALLDFPLAGFCIEVALHGTSTLEEALRALQSLTPQCIIYEAPGARS
jgi:hypothetical protein